MMNLANALLRSASPVPAACSISSCGVNFVSQISPAGGSILLMQYTLATFGTLADAWLMMYAGGASCD
jgi:hypothetical protein